MIDLDNLTSHPYTTQDFEPIFSALAKEYMPHIAHNLSLELIITDSTHTQKLNKAYRGKDSTTDVLSFPLEVDSSLIYPSECIIPLGTIILNAEISLIVAQNLGHNLIDELKLLFIHGLLHIFGFNHEVDNGEQRAQERHWIESFHLPKSLIERNTI